MMSAQKRSLETADPDYADAGEQQVKRQRALEQDAKEVVSRKIKTIVQNEFQKEINLKETELQTIDKRLNDALLQMDRLRACIVASYYGQKHPSSSSQTSSINAPPASIHPAVKKHLGKAPKGHAPTRSDVNSHVKPQTEPHERLKLKEQAPDPEDTRTDTPTETQRISATVASRGASAPVSFSERHARFKIKKKIIVGNVSKYIPVDSRESNDMSSHKWMVYVRGPKADPDISGFVKKVWFFLHHSYKPNDLVEVSSPPFHLTRRGWGEFPVRVQLHFVDPRNKKVDIIHHLKLDKTFTGLQTLGAEMVVEVEINRESSTSALSTTSSAASASAGLPLVSSDVSTSSDAVPQLSTSPCTSNETIPHQEIKKHKKHIISPRLSGENAHSDSSADARTFIKSNVDGNSRKDGSLLDIRSAVKSQAGEADEVNQERPRVAEGYHMTIAHDQGPSPVKATREEADQDVDVCTEDVPTRKSIPTVAKIRTGNSSHLETISGNLSEVEKEPIDASALILPSLTPSCNSPSNVVSEFSSEMMKSSLISPVTSLPSSSLNSSTPLKSTVLEQTNTPLYSPVGNLQTASSLSGKPSLPQPVKLTVIKDPLKSRPHLAATSSSATVIKAGVEITLASSASFTTCITTVSSTVTTTTTTAQSSGSCSLSVSSSLQEKIQAQNTLEGVPTMVFGAQVQHQQKGGVAVSKMVVIKPNPNLPTKVLHKANSPQSCNGVIASTFLPGNHISQSYRPVAGAGGGGIQPMVVSSTPPTTLPRLSGTRPGTARKVSLLTGLVVGGERSPLHRVRPAASHSLLGARTLKDNTATTDANIHTPISLDVQQAASLQGRQVLLLNKTNVASRTVVVPKQGEQLNTPGGRSVIKVISKAPASQAAPQTVGPVKILGSIPPKSVSLVSNVQSGLPQTSTPRFVSTNTTLDGGSASSIPETIEINAPVQLSHLETPASSSQVMLSFPGGATLPLAQEVETNPFPKMSAVGITKYGKGYRAVLAQQGPKKNLSEEERLKGQYEVLRAFKENPEMYRKKSKKVVLATNDTLEGEEDLIPDLQLEDYLTMRGLVKAAVLLHPIVQESVNKISHPYCANSMDEWNSWPLGKQRAAEWHRACFTLKYLRRCLAGHTVFKGEKLLSTRQLMEWCRLRAFSPVLPVKRKAYDISSITKSMDGTAGGQDLFYQADRENQLQSFSAADGLDSLLPDLCAEKLNNGELHKEKEYVNVVDEDTVMGSLIKEGKCDEDDKDEEMSDPDDWISPSQGATFVYDQLRKRGVRLEHQKLDDGVRASVPAEMIYRVMMEFCSDVLRETLAVCEDPLSEVTGQDVHRGLTSLPESGFCCNRFLGKQEEQGLEVIAVSR